MARLIKKTSFFKWLQSSTTPVTTAICFFVVVVVVFLPRCTYEMFLSSLCYSPRSLQELNVYRKPGPHSTLQFHQHKLHYEGSGLETNWISSQRSEVVEQDVFLLFYQFVFGKCRIHEVLKIQ